MLHSRKKNEGAYRIEGRGEKGPLCDPGSKLLTGKERASSARIVNGMKQEKKKAEEIHASANVLLS